MHATLRGLRRLALTSKSAAPKPAAVLAIEASIAERARDVAALKKKLNNAEAEVARWSGIKFNSPPETDMSQANEALKFYTEQAAAAQTALNEEKDRLAEERRLLLEQLNNEQKRQHELAMAALTGGQTQVPDFSPSPSFRLLGDVKFVESQASKDILRRLVSLASNAPTSNIRDLPYTIIYGIMGSGKSTAAWRTITQVCRELPTKKYIPCYLNLDALQRLFPKFKNEGSHSKVLATALLACFTNNDVINHGLLNLKQVGELAYKKYGSNNFLLHIDEFQSSPEATKQLIIACRETITSASSDICVVPIVSGIPGLDFPVAASQWLVEHVQLGPLPAKELWDSFLAAIGVPHLPFGEYKNLSILFNDCGAYASQVVSLVSAIKAEYPQLGGDLEAGQAGVVFEKALESIRSVYHVSRWHAIFSQNYLEDIARDPTAQGLVPRDPTSRNPWPKTKNIIKQVMLFVLTQKVISNMTNEVVPGITWENCKLTGMVDFVKVDEGGYIAKCSLFALFAMNDMTGALPKVARLNNVFDNGWQTHERLALVSFMIRLKVHNAGESVLLKDCRPKAHILTKAEVKIVVPNDTEYRPEERGLTVSTDLTVGRFLLTVDGEAGVDGVMLFDGLVNNEPRQILVLSQSKKRGNSTKDGVNTGEVSTARKTTIDVAQLLPLMRLAKPKLPPAVQGAFVVFDVFTDWNGPAHDWEADRLVLEDDEALIITERKTLDSVLGGLAGPRERCRCNYYLFLTPTDRQESSDLSAPKEHLLVGKSGSV